MSNWLERPVFCTSQVIGWKDVLGKSLKRPRFSAIQNDTGKSILNFIVENRDSNEP